MPSGPISIIPSWGPGVLPLKRLYQQAAAEAKGRSSLVLFRKDDPSTWDGFEFGVTCHKCGYTWQHRVKELDERPAAGSAISVPITLVCPSCGTETKGTVGVASFGQN
jgi:rubredoxin